MSSSVGQAKAMPFITIENGRFSLCEETAALIENTLGDEKSIVAVVAVVGLYRTGKSFLLNQLVGEQRGFEVGPSINPCTKGLWIWGAPITITNRYQEELKVLFIDTEGIASFTENETHDAQVFALAMLLSSYFIYNSLGSIDETAISRLSLVAEVSKHVRAKSNEKHDANDIQHYKSLSRYFPSFMWVVRDFALKLCDSEGKPITPKEYLEMALQPQPGDSEHVRQKNRVRTSVRESFYSRDCYTMVRPINDEDKLQRIAKLDEKEIRAEFRQQMQTLRKTIFSKVKPKELNGKLLNGRMLISLARSYVEAINKGSIIISSAWDTMVRAECEKAFSNALAYYKGRMTSDVRERGIIFEAPEFERIHREHEETAWKTFFNGAIGDDRAYYENQLKMAIADEYNSLCDFIRKSSSKHCITLINELFITIDKKLTDGDYPHFENFEKDITELLQKYNAVAKGPEKNNVLLSSLLRWSIPSARAIHKQVLERQERSYEESLLEKEKEHKRILDELVRSHEEEKKRMDARFNSLDQSRELLKEQCNELGKEIWKLEDQLSKKDRELANRSEEFEQKMERATAEIQHLNEQYASACKTNERLNEEIARLKDDTARLNDKLNAEIADLNDAVAKRDEEVIRLKAEIDRQSNEIAILHDEINARETQISKLVQENGEYKDATNQLNVTITDMKSKMDLAAQNIEETRVALDAMRAENDNLRNMHARELAIRDQTIEALQKKISTRDEKLQLLRKQSEELTHVLKTELNNIKTKHDQLAQAMQAEMEQHRQTKMQKDQLAAVIEKTEIQNQELSSVLESERKKREELHENIKQLRAENEKTAQALKQQQEQCDSLRTKLKETEETLACARLENEGAQQTLKAVKFEKNELAQSLKEAEKKCEILTEELNAASFHVKNVLTERSILERSLAITENKLHGIEHSKEDIETEKENLEQKVQRLNRELEDSHHRIKFLEKELQTHKSEREEDFSRLQKSLRESTKTQDRAAQLEIEVEKLNQTNRRVLKLNRKVMEENKNLRNELLKVLREFNINTTGLSAYANQLTSATLGEDWDEQMNNITASMSQFNVGVRSSMTAPQTMMGRFSMTATAGNDNLESELAGPRPAIRRSFEEQPRQSQNRRYSSPLQNGGGGGGGGGGEASHHQGNGNINTDSILNEFQDVLRKVKDSSNAGVRASISSNNNNNNSAVRSSLKDAQLPPKPGSASTRSRVAYKNSLRDEYDRDSAPLSAYAAPPPRARQSGGDSMFDNWLNDANNTSGANGNPLSSSYVGAGSSSRHSNNNNSNNINNLSYQQLQQQQQQPPSNIRSSQLRFSYPSSISSADNDI